ncbi:Prohibitin [Tupaia chinensis]|uniref:Prohibitin n=1 Tax=Tupaia chinensis TaxID=246437 RepID=L9L2T6_TUPCH|nr:Prohibitin [Tupaia chinensis]
MWALDTDLSSSTDSVEYRHYGRGRDSLSHPLSAETHCLPPPHNVAVTTGNKDLQNVNVRLHKPFQPVASQLPRLLVSISEDCDEQGNSKVSERMADWLATAGDGLTELRKLEDAEDVVEQPCPRRTPPTCQRDSRCSSSCPSEAAPPVLLPAS